MERLFSQLVKAGINQITLERAFFPQNLALYSTGSRNLDLRDKTNHPGYTSTIPRVDQAANSGLRGIIKVKKGDA